MLPHLRGRDNLNINYEGRTLIIPFVFLSAEPAKKITRERIEPTRLGNNLRSDISETAGIRWFDNKKNLVDIEGMRAA